MIPIRIIFHHSGDMSTLDQFEKIDRYHKSKNFPRSVLNYYVGYHYVIEYDGLVRQARNENEIGAHDTGENTNSLGICLAGDFNMSVPTKAQEASAALLVKQILSRWPIPLTRFEPHRLDDLTDCPGKMLPDNWLAKQYLTREGNPMHRLLWTLGDYLKLL